MTLLQRLSPAERVKNLRSLCRRDLFFLLRYVLNRPDIDQPWLFDRCREVEAEPNGTLDLWAREHFKSTIITFGKTIQDILASHGDDPLPEWGGRELTVGIFSNTRPNAKKFLRQIMREFETNALLKSLFPDILWEHKKQAPKWALAVDTPVLTTSGWKSHGDLEPGDHIFGSSGQVITVTGNSGPMHGADCRRVVFDDCELVASSEHLWPVQCKKSTGTPWNDAVLKIQRTEELVVGGKISRLLATPALKPTFTGTLPVHPYVLGLWLGDGTAGTNIISMHREDEREVLAEISACGFETYVHRRQPADNFSMYGVRGLKELLSGLGCIKDKAVHDCYLRGSYEERLALLQGLMDSDGTCKKPSKSKSAGMCMFSNTNTDLVKSVFHLAASLGLRPSVLNFVPKSRGKKRVYHVYFVGIRSVPPFRLSRKLAHCKAQRTKIGRYVRGVHKIPSVTVNCIKVDAPDSLYLAGTSMVPTHNSEDDGIVVKRKGNPKEATVEAWGLVDGQPVGPHFGLLVYDDVVTQASVTTPEMIKKTTTMWEMSLSLGVQGGPRRYIGTIYAMFDTYWTMRQRGIKARVYPATLDGTDDCRPENCRFMSSAVLSEKRREYGPSTFASQMLLDPKAAAISGFKEEWLKWWPGENQNNLSVVIIVDPASKKKKTSDYSAFWVLGLGSDKNWYVLDHIHDRLDLKGRVTKLIHLHRVFGPQHVFYEEYGLQADIEAANWQMERENYRFTITPVGGQIAKEDRIKRLQPLFENRRIFLPEGGRVHVNYEGVAVNTIQRFINEEYLAFPVVQKDDALDCLSRIEDEDLKLFVSPPSDAAPSTPTFMEQIMVDHHRQTGTGNGRSWMGR